MMNDDQLRDRIGRLDPTGGASIDPVTSPSARALLEDIMSTPPPAPAETSPRRPSHGRPLWRIAGVAAAVVAIAVGVAVVANGGGDDEGELAITTTTPPTAPATDPTPTSPAPTEPVKAKVLELSAPVEDMMAMCAVLDPTVLSQAPIAFKGTVTMAENGVVQLTIDEAYKGTDAQAATLSAPEGMEALIGGVEWVVGEQYLVSAYDGVVSYCGQTGPATPELQALFDQAFAA
jgi:hypothetical protein